MTYGIVLCRAVDGAKKFMVKLNSGIEERTFCKTFALVGGPMNKYQGRIGSFE